MAAAVIGTTVVGEAVVGGDRLSSVGSSPGRWLLRIIPLLFRTMRRHIHRHRSMGHGGGVTPRSLTTPTRRLAPAGSEPFSPGETETKTRVDDISGTFMFFRLPRTRDGTRNAPPSSSASGWASMRRGARRVFQHLLAETHTGVELIAERKFRRRLLTDDAMSRSPVAICGSGMPHP
jgi:hypothetical protein